MLFVAYQQRGKLNLNIQNSYTIYPKNIQAPTDLISIGA